MATPPGKPFFQENMTDTLKNKLNNSSLIDKRDSNSYLENHNQSIESVSSENCTNSNNTQSKKKKKKKKKTRCYHCNIKLKIVNFGCKCQSQFRFCTKCKMPEYHNCPIDWKKIYKEKLNKTLPKIITGQLESI